MRGKWVVVLRTQCKNNSLELQNALNSLVAQQYENMTILLLLHSDKQRNIDRTVRFVKNFKKVLDIKVIIVKEKQGNRSHPLNVALKELKSIDAEYVSFLDHDDVYYPNMGSLLINLMNQNNAVFSCGKSIRAEQKLEKDDYGNKYLYTVSKRKFESKDFSVFDLLLDNYIPFNSYILKVEYIKNMEFDEELNFLEDWDFLRRLIVREDFSFIQTDLPVSEYRIRNDRTDTFNSRTEKTWIRCRNLIDEKQKMDKIQIPMSEISAFRNDYFKKMSELGQHLNYVENNIAYKTWKKIVNSKFMLKTFTKFVRDIRHLIKDS